MYRKHSYMFYFSIVIVILAISYCFFNIKKDVYYVL